jgi:type VI secretion system secreted protein Hcp
MQKILLGAIIAAAVLLVYPSLMMSEQSAAQTPDQGTDNTVTGSVLPCNTSTQTRAGSFLTVDGMTGPNGSPCVFEIKDFSFGVENPTTIGSATGGAGAGKVKFNEFTIKKTVDSASPSFFKNCATGSHYKTVTLTMRKAGGDPHSSGQAFKTFTFGTVFTTKINWSGPGDEGPEESITFVYGTLSVEYKPQKPDGTLGVPITSCFDSVRNAVC